MAGEHGSCCCNHDNPQTTHDESEHSAQPTSATTASGCCGGASAHMDISRSNPHAEEPASEPPEFRA